MGWRLQLSDKTVRKFAELPIYCQRQKCTAGNVVSGSIKFMQIFAWVRWKGGVKWEWGRWTVEMAISASFVHCLPNILHTWPHDSFHMMQLSMTLGIFQGQKLFHIKFLKNGAWYGKDYYRPLTGNHTIAFDWCHFWWPWSTFEGHFQPRLSFPRSFQQSLACFRVARSPSNSWASCW